ncbi:MAG: sulfatase, partial [Anaerolineae bacterium]|nr:sulfatase [Anaerolineae bacterium]
TEWGFTISPGRMLRTDRFKYARYLEGMEQGLNQEFYDMQADPGETCNLIGHPAFQDEIRRHRALLQMHIAETGDDFYSLDWLADPRWRSHTPGYQYHRGPAAPVV